MQCLLQWGPATAYICNSTAPRKRARQVQVARGRRSESPEASPQRPRLSLALGAQRSRVDVGLLTRMMRLIPMIRIEQFTRLIAIVAMIGFVPPRPGCDGRDDNETVAQAHGNLRTDPAAVAPRRPTCAGAARLSSRLARSPRVGRAPRGGRASLQGAEESAVRESTRRNRYHQPQSQRRSE